MCLEDWVSTMARPGPKRQVSNERLLLELLVSGENSVFASEIEPQVNIELQQVRDRLNELVDETPYVSRKKASGRNLYSLTDEGREHILTELRKYVD
jgi:predicted transcriptional regulator